MNDGLNARDLRMVNEQREGVADHRGAPQLAILLGCDAPRTDATASRHHDGRYPSRHRIHSYFSMSRRVGKGAWHSRWQVHWPCAPLPTPSDFASAMAPMDRVGKGGKQNRLKTATTRPPLPTLRPQHSFLHP